MCFALANRPQLRLVAGAHGPDIAEAPNHERKHPRVLARAAGQHQKGFGIAKLTGHSGDRQDFSVQCDRSRAALAQIRFCREHHPFVSRPMRPRLSVKKAGAGQRSAPKLIERSPCSAAFGVNASVARGCSDPVQPPRHRSLSRHLWRLAAG
jgi:hypothetical protein